MGQPADRDPGGLFARRHGYRPAGVWLAPGRVNLIGEHLDYNDGFVLPLAIGLAARVAVGPARPGPTVVWSAQAPDAPRSFTAASTEPSEAAALGWGAYVAGVFWALRDAGLAVADVDMAIDSSVPLGAGLSSSAALECAVAIALSDQFGLSLPPARLAALARRAENDYVGAPTGGMDQLASAHGRADELVLIDTRTLDVSHLPLPLSAHGLALTVIDTGTRHALVNSEYGRRRASCDNAASSLGVTALRDVDPAGLAAALAALPDETARKRVRHVVTENDRVLAVASLLRSGRDPREIGPLLTASHASLREDFEVSTPELDLAVDTAVAAGAHGARLTGAGFGGCAIALVDESRAGAVEQALGQAFSRANLAAPGLLRVRPSAGARRLR